MSSPSPRPSYPPMQRPPPASTVSSPPLPINSLSSLKLPPSLSSPSSSVSASAFGVRPMPMYPLRSCRCAAHPCPVHNRYPQSSLQLFSPPQSFFVFGDGFCDMRTFCTRGYRESGPAEKNLVGKPSSLGQSVWI